jgi:hypothetical protein
LEKQANEYLFDVLTILSVGKVAHEDTSLPPPLDLQLFLGGSLNAPGGIEPSTQEFSSTKKLYFYKDDAVLTALGAAGTIHNKEYWSLVVSNFF